MKPHTLCWWLVGPDYIMYDLHDAIGRLVRPNGHDESATLATHLPAHATRAAAQGVALHMVTRLATELGIHNVVHDDDTEEQYKDYFYGR